MRGAMTGWLSPVARDGHGVPDGALLVNGEVVVRRLAVIGVVLSLVGCGGNESDSSDGRPSASTTAVAPSELPAPTGASLMVVRGTVTVVGATNAIDPH